MSIDSMWKIIARYDTYIVSTNQKAAVLIAYNTLVIGGLVLKREDVFGLFDGHPAATHLAAVFIFIVAAVSLASLWLTFFMILPYMWSPKKANSVIFYGDVAAHSRHEDYQKQVTGTSDEVLLGDLTTQAYAVARGASTKFRWMRLGVLLILFLQIPAMAAILVLKLCLFL